MATPKEQLYSHNRLRAGQQTEYANMAKNLFAPHETTRISQYYLPLLHETALPLFNETSYETALNRLLNGRGEKIRILDLGCGAGFWLEEQAANPRLEVFGISARDYRSPDQRPPVVFAGRLDGTGMPMYKHPEFSVTYVGYELERTCRLDDSHYLLGDMHTLLPTLPANYFHLIVSYQACRYLFDPLRVLKQVHRLLAPKGYAFLESFSANLVDQEGEPLTENDIQKLLRRCGQPINYGAYPSRDGGVKRGLAIKKTKPRLKLPVRYQTITPTVNDEDLDIYENTQKVIYSIR